MRKSGKLSAVNTVDKTHLGFLVIPWYRKVLFKAFDYLDVYWLFLVGDKSAAEVIV